MHWDVPVRQIDLSPSRDNEEIKNGSARKWLKVLKKNKLRLNLTDDADFSSKVILSND